MCRTAVPQTLAVLGVLLATPAVHAQKVDPAARAAVVTAQQKQASQRAFRVIHRSTSIDQGRTSSARLIYVAPDRYHSTDLDGLARIEVIRIGNTGWMKFPGEAWQPEIVAAAGTMRWFRGPTSIDDPEHKLLEARALGPAALGDVKTSHYEYLVGRGQDRLRVKVWVAAATGLPVRFEADDKRAASHDRITWEIAYDDTLRIDRPVK